MIHLKIAQNDTKSSILMKYSQSAEDKSVAQKEFQILYRYERKITAVEVSEEKEKKECV